MNTIARMILVAVLAFGSGCAKPDWIEQTLVTVDVTGRWQGSTGTAIRPTPPGATGVKGQGVFARDGG